MKTIGLGGGLLVAALLSFHVFAAGDFVEAYLDPSLIQTSGDPAVGTGQFYGYRVASEGPGADAFQKCLSKAQAEYKPLVVIWSNQGCEHCSAFTGSLNDNALSLSAWMRGKDAIFSFFKDSSGNYGPTAGHQPAACYDAYAFTVECGVPVGAVPWPFYAFYLLKPDGSVAIEAGSFAGQSAEGFMARFDAFLDANPVEIPLPGDAAFACGSSSGARLEAMPSTLGVWVPVARTNNCSVAATNTLTAIFPNGEKATSNIVWAATDALRQTQEVFFPTAAGWTDGGSATLLLRDGNGVLNAKSAITYIAEATPSHHFPLWLGERNEDTLGWGEWTFDFDVATNKVLKAARNGATAYTLVVAGGGLWCPDCVSCERDLTEKSGFTAWAAANNIALVVSDQPRNGTTTSSMVTHDVGGRGASVTSGSYYLSRKGLTMAEGMAQFSAMTNRSYRLWKIEPAAVRVGNPTFILFRPDGTIAGRLVGDRNMYRPKAGANASSSDAFDFDENIVRLTELLETADDATEERNGKAWTTPLVHAFGRTNTCMLSVCDMADVFRLDGFPAGEPVKFSFSWPGNAKAEPSFRVFRVTDAAAGTMENLTRISEVEDVWRFTQEQLDAGLYLEVAAYDRIVSGTTIESRWTAYGADTGIEVTFHAETVPPDPGVVGFSDSAFTVDEDAGAFDIRVARTRGASGGVIVRVERDDAVTTADPARYAWDANDIAAHTLLWNETETGEQSVRVPVVDDTVWDGDQAIGFRLVALSADGVEWGRTNITVTLLENDTRSAGTIAISGTNPRQTAPMVVDAKPNGDVAFTVSRLDGSWGEAGVSLTVSDPSATLSASRLTWADKNENLPRRSGEQTVTMHIPEPAGGSAIFKVALAADEGTRIDVARSILYVRVRSAAEIGYSPAATALKLKRYTSFSCVFTPESAPPAGTLSAAVVFDYGFLPPGLEISLDKDTGVVEISGVPCRTGDFTAAFHVAFTTASGVIRSMPVVMGAAVEEPKEENPQLGVSHVFYDLPVVGRSSRRLAGLLDIAIPISGRVSARYRSVDGRKFSFSAKSWDDVEDAENGGVATVSRVRAGCGFALAFGPDGIPAAEISDPSADEGLMVVAPTCGVWSASSPATAWQGIYTVEMPCDTNAVPVGTPLCTGPAALTCRMTSTASCNEGRMLVAGILPNGKAFSAASHLLAESRDVALMPIMNGSGSDSFGALLHVAADGGLQKDETRQMIRRHGDFVSFWAHSEPNAASLSYNVELDAFGSWYDPDEDWQARWRADYFVDWEDPSYAEHTMRFIAEAADGLATPMCAVGTEVRVADEAENPLGLSFSLGSYSGVMSGTMSLDFGGSSRTVRYKGVFLPGWAEGCGCGSFVTTEAEVVRPFASAPCWWDEMVSYEDDNGNQRQRTVRKGAGVSIDR